MKLTAPRVKKLRELLADIVRLDDEQVPDAEAPSLEEMARRAKELLPHLTPRPKLVRQLPAGVRDTKLERKAARRLTLAEILVLVDQRCRGRCEVPGCPHPRFSYDHWLGGNGRRRVAESVETIWGLCKEHDRMRTANEPSAGKWNGHHRLFAQQHDYAHLDHVEHQAPPSGLLRLLAQVKTAPSCECGHGKEVHREYSGICQGLVADIGGVCLCTEYRRAA